MSPTGENSIILDYFRITKEYQELYGEKTILLMQVGTFFEVYALKNPTTHHHEVTHIDAFSEICNMVIAEKSFSMGNEAVRDAGFPPFPRVFRDVPVSKTNLTIQAWMKTIPRSKVVMAGHSILKVEHYVQKLTEAGYTAVVYVQEKDTNNNVIGRKLQAIYSPGTFLGNTELTHRITNNIMGIWLEKTHSPLFPQDMLTCGISNINIFTGDATLFEYTVPYYLNPTTFDELERSMTTFAPNEIVVISDFPDDVLGNILKYVGVSNQITVHVVRLGEGNGAEGSIAPSPTSGGGGGGSANRQKALNCTKQTYIHQMLSTFFGTEAFQTCAEFRDNIVATQAFCYLLNFVQEHNPDLVRRIRLPQFTNTSLRMVLANHTLKQLNIVCDESSDSKQASQLSSVSTFLNRCCTSMGKRKFRHQLTNPTFDTGWLAREYETIDRAQQVWSQPKLGELRRSLRLIRDTDKICRQIVTKRVVPAAITQLYHSIKLLDHLHGEEVPESLHTYLMDEGAGSGSGTGSDLTDRLRGFLVFLESRFYLDNCASIQSQTCFDQNIIKPGIYSKLDTCMESYRTAETLLDDLYKGLTQWVKVAMGVKEDCIKLHDTEKSGKSFQITKKRSISFKKVLDNKSNPATRQITIVSGGITHIIQAEHIQIVTVSSNYDRILFPLLTETTQTLLELEGAMNGMIGEVYTTIMEEMETQWYDQIEVFSHYLARLDVLVTKAYLANEYHYCRPQLVESDKACVYATKLRHCLIEHLQTQEIYVTNDISLGDGSPDGILLYGTNAVGKTSIIRALGIAVIMAQAGCYVPCAEFRFKPYTAIFSRILGNDNIFKGLSTFAVEMSELRMILKMADKDSLILGDELCSGTEIESALSIFMSGLIHLHDHRSSFIFATHFHDILNFQEMVALTRVHIKHMSVFYDRELDCLVYDRLLKDGPGTRMYGLEVCKSLYLPTEFLERAYTIRNNYYSDTRSELALTPSHYNSRKLVGICEYCGTTMGEEVHHMEYQHAADTTGYIGHFHKNHVANLMSVCQECHDKIHEDDSRGNISPITQDIREGEPGPGPPVLKKKLVRRKTTRGYMIRG